MIRLTRAVLAMILTLSTCEAQAHCYRIWKYPKPQKCFTALVEERIGNGGQHVSTFTQLHPASPSFTQLHPASPSLAQGQNRDSGSTSRLGDLSRRR